MNTQEAWYVLEDGSSADPNDVALDEAGALRHKDGLAVAMKGNVPHTRGVDADAERAKASADKEKEPKKVTKEIVAEKPKKTYHTRETKSE